MQDYKKERFNALQIEQICIGTEKGLNVSVYSKPIFRWE